MNTTFESKYEEQLGALHKGLCIGGNNLERELPTAIALAAECMASNMPNHARIMYFMARLGCELLAQPTEDATVEAVIANLRSLSDLRGFEAMDAQSVGAQLDILVRAAQKAPSPGLLYTLAAVACERLRKACGLQRTGDTTDQGEERQLHIGEGANGL
jgi:hypothetical protein